ncbi:hypothetical protein H8S20_17420 [Clostridium sp. NSJ-6]|uniref:Uncharacterized protein n=1 Tax=Clostridium hominis TaxID=2763036 RepID=A0ABR7DGW0_9CLOT|nr:hypothetical protein [Clostridium hominis]MBC5630641.1 hypothetical protein [Clostridium hominis]
MLKWLSRIWDGICAWTVTGIGTGIATTGIVIKELAVVVIMIGILLWMYRITKVFRWGAAGYLIGLVLEILGSLMI